MTRFPALLSLVAVLACGSSTPPATAPDSGPPVTGACGSSVLLDRSGDRSAKGPWPVGTLATSVGDFPVEVWYPATVGSDVGKPLYNFDIRQDLPPNDAALISDATNPLQPCDCVQGLPLDTTHGPYPLVVFVHGTAGFKTQNLDNVVHWASRGFVVMAADHPGLCIASFLGTGDGGTLDLAGDVAAEIAAMTAATGDLAMFSGHVDLANIGLVGHSAGGNAVAGLGGVPNAKVIIPLAANQPTTGSSFVSTLSVGGLADQVVPYATQQAAYQSAVAPNHKRLVGIEGCGHTGVTSLCGIENDAGQNIVEVAEDAGVLTGALVPFADLLFDCAANSTPQSQAVPIVNDATSAVLEETLQCDSSANAAINGVQVAFPKVTDYEHTP